MPDLPTTIPAAVTVDAAAQPQPQASGTDVPAWAQDLQKRVEGLYRETVEARKEFRSASKEKPASPPPASAPGDVEARLNAMSRELAFRDSLEGKALPAKERSFLVRLFKAEQPENVEEWVDRTIPEISAPAHPQAPAVSAAQNVAAAVQASLRGSASAAPGIPPTQSVGFDLMTSTREQRQALGTAKLLESVNAAVLAEGGGNPFRR
jgi:hypothetical protein